MFYYFSPVIFQSPVCVPLTALVSLVFARLLPVTDVVYHDVLYPCLLVVHCIDSFAFIVHAEFQVGIQTEFQL